MAWPFDDQPITPQATASSLPAFPWLVGNSPQPQQSQGFGDDAANFAASKTPEVSYRAAMLPYGEDAQGRGHWAVPGMLYGPAMAAARLFGQGGFWNGPQDPQAAEDMRDVLMSLYGGNALARGSALPLGGLGRVAASLEAGPGDLAAQLMSKIGRVGEEAGAPPIPRAPLTARVYRGAPQSEQWPPTTAVNDTFWASSDPEVAATFAGNYRSMNDIRLPPAHITPAEVRFENPLVIDAEGRPWDNIPFGEKRYTTDAFASLARRHGYDGLVLRNVRDDGPLATTYAALRPGTVFSPLTGEQLYANGSGLPGLLGVPSNAQQGRAPR